MAQSFKETAHLKTNIKAYHDGWDRIFGRSINGHCPHCNTNLDGDLIIDTLENPSDASNFAGWNEHGDKNRWSRAMIVHGDVNIRICPDCRGEL